MNTPAHILSRTPAHIFPHRLFVFGQRVAIPDKDRVADRHPGTELTYESAT
jgi:hypothetical protein